MTPNDRRALASWERALETPKEADPDDECCSRPGPRGCGICEGCCAIADAAYDDIGE